MPDKIVTGTPGMIPQGIVRTHSPRAGYTYSLRWVGEKKFGPGIEQQLIALGYETSFTEDGPSCIVEGKRSGVENPTQQENEIPVERWERNLNVIEADIYRNPTLMSELQNDGNIATLKEQIADREFNLLDYTGGVETQAYEWFKLILAGVESFTIYQPVVIVTKTVSDRYDKKKILRTNVGKILNRAQMLKPIDQGGEGAPEFVVEDSIAGVSQALYTTIPGYLKGDPRFTTAADNKWEVTIEYIAGQWASKLYSAAS